MRQRDIYTALTISLAAHEKSKRRKVLGRSRMAEHLFNPDGPALSVLAATPFTVAKLLMTWTPSHPQWDIVRLRGTKSSDDSSLFDEVATALQFPYYFGENCVLCGTALQTCTGSKVRASLSYSIRRSICYQHPTADFRSCYNCSPRRMTNGFGNLPTSSVMTANRSHSNPY